MLWTIETLRYFWRSSAAVVLAAAVTSAVLTGALLVGDSVRGSLRDLTLERLGRIDDALLGEQFFRAELAEELERPVGLAAAVPAIVMQGAVRHADSGTRASQVNVQGIDERFASLYPEQAELLDFGEGGAASGVLINETLASELGARPGDTLILALERPSDIPRETLMGSTAPADVVRSLRLELRAVVPDRGVGRFGLMPHQTHPLNAWVELPALQRALDQRGRANALFLAWEAGGDEPDEARLAELLAAISRSLTLDDVGLVAEGLTVRGDGVEGGSAFLELSSREVILRPGLADAIERWAEDAGVRVQSVSTYLANLTRRPGATVRSRGNSDPYLPYSTITALETPVPEGFGELRLVDGAPAPALAENEVLLNAWAAEDLGVGPGDVVAVDYYEVGEREELITRSVELRVRGIVAMSGLGADPTLTPEFPGVADADSMSDWDPTFPVDLSLIRERDEDYWDLYRGAPKLFVAAELGPRLWGSRFGDLSALRLAPPEGTSAWQLGERLAEELPATLDLRSAGLAVQPVKASGLRAARGATDFSGLFIGFSLFLIVSAALLVALFFRLGVEQRVRELGLRLAVGFPVSRVRRQFLVEGLALGGLGALLGLGGAVLYAWAMMTALGTLWIGAVGTPFLELHVVPATLAIGFLASLAVIAIAIWRAVRRLAERSTVSLLRGETRQPASSRPGRRARLVALVALVGAVGLSAASAAVGQGQAAPLFFGVGACVLVLGLALFALWLARVPSGRLEGGWLGLLRMAGANAALSPGRSLLAAALVASASFVIVAVGSYGLQFGEELREKESGAGGYALRAQSDIPLYHDLDDPEGRFELGFGDDDSELLARSTIVPFRVVPGDDVSCLNLYQPEQPRLLGVPEEQIERGGFTVTPVGQGEELMTAMVAGEGGAEPWRLLEADLGEDVIPALGDYNSVTWILKLVSPLGEVRDVVLEDERGNPVRIRLVGTLKRSIFQSELLIAEDRLEQHWPSRTGWSYFLLDTPAEVEEETVAALEDRLAAFGLDVSTTAQVLQGFQSVENTYLATFQTLGGLGLLLGTLGLAVILLRNVLERRAELATLRAVGFRKRRLGGMVVAENTVVLVAGLAIGTVAALVAVAPHLAEASAAVPWGSLALTLVLVLIVGTLASIAAVRSALRVDLIGGLRGD